MTKKIDNTVQIFNLTFFGSQFSNLLTRLESTMLNSRETSYIFTPNPEQIVLARHDQGFFSLLKQADLLLPDGGGIVWAAHLLAPESSSTMVKIPGREVAEWLVAWLQEHETPGLIVGSRDLSTSWLQQHPTLRWTPGYQAVQAPTNEEEQAVIQLIKKIKPEVVFVAFGAPWQEQWALEHRQVFESCGVKLVLVVGGAFDVITGKLQRPPQLFQRLGLEWLFRLWQQPWRWRRQLALITFVWLTLGEFFKKRR